MTSYEESCYFFEYEVDMGAHIPLCSLSGAFEPQNCVKYVSRAGRKDDILQDLKKARQYLDFEIEYLEKEREEK